MAGWPKHDAFASQGAAHHARHVWKGARSFGSIQPGPTSCSTPQPQESMLLLRSRMPLPAPCRGTMGRFAKPRQSSICPSVVLLGQSIVTATSLAVSLAREDRPLISHLIRLAETPFRMVRRNLSSTFSIPCNITWRPPQRPLAAKSIEGIPPRYALTQHLHTPPAAPASLTRWIVCSVS